MVNESDLKDILSEAGVLSTLILQPSYLYISEKLTYNNFSQEENKCLFIALKNLIENEIPIDSVNLITNVNGNKLIKNIMSKNLDIEKFINDFLDNAPYVARSTPDEYKQMYDNLMTISFKKEILKMTKNINQQCMDGNVSLEDLSEKIYTFLDAIGEKYTLSNEVFLWSEVVDGLWESYKEKKKHGDIGLPSAFSSLNEYLSYEPTELTVFLAEAKGFKSLILFMEAIHKMENGVGVAVWDTEMSDDNVFNRFLAYLSKIPMKRIRKEMLTDEEWIRLEKAKDEMKTYNFAHYYEPESTTQKFFAWLKSVQKKMNVGLIIYDYLKTDDVDSYNKLGEMTNYLKNNISGKLKIPVITAAQLNRQHEVGDSIKIVRYSSTIIYIFRKTPEEIMRDGEECGNIKLFIKENRIGDRHSDPEVEYIDLYADGNISTIVEAKQHILQDDPF